MRYDYPDTKGYFGEYGGKFVPETLMEPLKELEKAYYEINNSSNFKDKLSEYMKDYTGRPTPLYFAQKLTERIGGAKIYLKREDLLHTGAHKINNTIGQVLLAKIMGKERIIAETGAGQHGVATATACALLNMKCRVYMGEEDMRRQSVNVTRMKILGAEIIGVSSGSQTLKDAINETIRDWVTNIDSTHYCIGSVVGPHPYPKIVRDFQSIIGIEAKKQIIEKEGRLPDILIASVGGGSNSIGLFYPFIEDKKVKMIGVEGGGLGLDTFKHAATLSKGKIGVLHGAMSYLLYDDNGNILSTHSVSAGLDYPGVGPEHSFLKDEKRVNYTFAKDDETLEAFKILSEQEGIIPALESSHAIAVGIKIAKDSDKDKIIIINLSGRGDKDLDIVGGLL